MIEVRLTPTRTIAADANFEAILAGYAAESALKGAPDPACQMELYNSMYDNGFIHPLAAYRDGELVGVLLLMCTVLPHYGCQIATAESYFVLEEHRDTGAGIKLLRAAEDLAKDLGAKGVLISAPFGGRLAEVLPRSGYKESNRVFFRGFA